MKEDNVIKLIKKRVVFLFLFYFIIINGIFIMSFQHFDLNPINQKSASKTVDVFDRRYKWLNEAVENGESDLVMLFIYFNNMLVFMVLRFPLVGILGAIIISFRTARVAASICIVRELPIMLTMIKLWSMPHSYLELSGYAVALTLSHNSRIRNIRKISSEIKKYGLKNTVKKIIVKLTHDMRRLINFIKKLNIKKINIYKKPNIPNVDLRSEKQKFYKLFKTIKYQLLLIGYLLIALGAIIETYSIMGRG